MIGGYRLHLPGLTFDIGGGADVCDVGDDRPQGVGNPTMACNFFLGILLRSVHLPSASMGTHVLGELLTRLQLHVPAADIRKHIELEEIKSSALVRLRRAYTELMRWLKFCPTVVYHHIHPMWALWKGDHRAQRSEEIRSAERRIRLLPKMSSEHRPLCDLVSKASSWR